MQPARDYGVQALAFLTEHRLAPTPHNYTLAYLVLTKPKSLVATAVAALVDGGIRIKQAEANEILALHADSAGYSVSSDGGDTYPDALRHQTLKLSETASSAAAASGAFTRDLSADAEALDGDRADTMQIIYRMIERSRRAEAELNAAALEVEELRQKLEIARGDAERDQLTGLANRLAIERHLLKLAEEGRQRVIGICDVDHFKSINDRYGHGVGDRVLKQIASTLASTCAPHFVGRWGGEEFLLVLEGDNEELGVTLLNRARSELSARDFKLRKTNEPIGTVSFSAGVAVAGGEHENSVAAIRHADALLYRAKAAGRNRVVGS